MKQKWHGCSKGPASFPTQRPNIPIGPFCWAHGSLPRGVVQTMSTPRSYSPRLALSSGRCGHMIYNVRQLPHSACHRRYTFHRWHMTSPPHSSPSPWLAPWGPWWCRQAWARTWHPFLSDTAARGAQPLQPTSGCPCPFPPCVGGGAPRLLPDLLPALVPGSNCLGRPWLSSASYTSSSILWHVLACCLTCKTMCVSRFLTPKHPKLHRHHSECLWANSCKPLFFSFCFSPCLNEGVSTWVKQLGVFQICIQSIPMYHTDFEVLFMARSPRHSTPPWSMWWVRPAPVH